MSTTFNRMQKLAGIKENDEDDFNQELDAWSWGLSEEEERLIGEIRAIFPNISDEKLKQIITIVTGKKF